MATATTDTEDEDTFTMKVRLGNAAMLTSRDLGAAVHAVGEKIKAGQQEGKVLDGNGNTVGEFSVTYPDLAEDGAEDAEDGAEEGEADEDGGDAGSPG